MKFFVSACCIVCAAAVLSGCATVEVSRDISSYGEQIARLEQKLTINPDNASALRDLGVIYFLGKRYLRADSLLAHAVKADPGDSKALFYRGMTLEALDDTTGALSVYINYTDFGLFSPYRRLMEGRYRALSSHIIHQQFQALLAREQTLSPNDAEAGTVAVFPMQFTDLTTSTNLWAAGSASCLSSTSARSTRCASSSASVSRRFSTS